jgi:sugar O-acyltransferase (sialic acid O-acetyltransferase NeuD family)
MFGRYSYDQIKVNEDLFIYGVGELSSIAYDYFQSDSPYNVCGYIADKEYNSLTSKSGLTIYDYDKFKDKYSENDVSVFVAVSAIKLNSEREKLIKKVQEDGYVLANYVSSYSFIDSEVLIGSNCFVFENNVIQKGVSVGTGNIFWSGNHIGHQSKIGNFNFFSSHVVLSGYCHIGDNNFFGINSSIHDRVNIGNRNIIAASANISKNCLDDTVYAGSPGRQVPGLLPKDVVFN